MPRRYPVLLNLQILHPGWLYDGFPTVNTPSLVIQVTIQATYDPEFEMMKRKRSQQAHFC